MLKRSLPTRLFAEVLSLAGASLFLSLLPSLVYSAPSTHVVISEVQISGDNADDEFVELYNPTGVPVDLTGWRLARRTAADTNDTNNLVASISGTIPAYGHFLIAHPEYDGVTADLLYSATSSALASNNSILLYQTVDQNEVLVDLVGTGNSTNKEASSAAVPQDNGSIERKALPNSTLELMLSTHASQGNGEDSDNNSLDFVVREISDPQNASSSPEPLTLSPSPTPTETATPTATPTVTPTPSESPTATPTASPTMEPTVSPTVEPSPTASPTASPTSEPTISPSPTGSATPSASPTATPRVLARWSFPFSVKSCSLQNTKVSFGFFTMNIPVLSCN